MKKIKVLSIFNGMNCIGLALNKLDIKAQIYASEIDKYANKVSNTLFPGTINLGCVTKVFAKDLPIIDLFVGGSPCQGFSFAGKGLNFKDPRSKLFFEYVRILRELQKINPNVIFLLENVRMKKQHEDFISKTLGIEPIMINSSLLSAQNRERLYWTNICSKQGLLFKECEEKQPKDKGIFLKHILESEVDKKYFLSDKMINSLLAHQKFNKFSTQEIDSENKSSCVTDRVHKMGNNNTYIKISKYGKLKTNQNKASCLTGGGHSGGNHSDMDLFIFNQVKQLNKSKESGEKQLYQQNRVYVTNCEIRRLTPRECAGCKLFQNGLLKRC